MSARAPQRRWPSFWFHLLAGLVLIGGGVWMSRDIGAQAGKMASGASLHCPYQDAAHAHWWFVLAGIIALVAGSLFGEWRHRPGDLPPATKWERLTFQLGLLGLYAALFFTFRYETIGLSNFQGQEPITYYVRCGVGLDIERTGGLVNLLVVVLLSFILGTWFWPRFRPVHWRAREEKRERQRAHRRQHWAGQAQATGARPAEARLSQTPIEGGSQE